MSKSRIQIMHFFRYNESFQKYISMKYPKHLNYTFQSILTILVDPPLRFGPRIRRTNARGKPPPKEKDTHFWMSFSFGGGGAEPSVNTSNNIKPIATAPRDLVYSDFTN